MNLFTAGGMSREEIKTFNSLQLAYIGDTVWEMIVRNVLIRRRMTVHHMPSTCVQYVNAHAQATLLKQIEAEATDEEKDIIRRGRNAHARHPSPRHQEKEDYASSTAFEALVGFWFLTGQEDRLSDLKEVAFSERTPDADEPHEPSHERDHRVNTENE